MTTLYFNIKSEFFLHAHLFHNRGKCSGFAILVWFDPLADEVHHLLTAQHIPANTQKHKRDLTAESKHGKFGVGFFCLKLQNYLTSSSFGHHFTNTPEIS